MYIFYNEFNDVTLIWYQVPTSEVLKSINMPYFILDSAIEKVENRAGFTTKMKCDPETKKVWYEYVERPKSPEEEKEQRLQALEVAMANILGM
jgi:hypothetical protein